MKQLAVLIFSVVCTKILSQAPQSIPYQAVVRNTDGTVLSNTNINMTFKMHDVSATGTIVYEEIHTITSNAQGLVALNVGGGTPITGAFNTINWGNGAKFLHVLMNTGNGVIDLGTQQMMSVPYALYANEVKMRVSAVGDSLFIGSQFQIVPGISSSDPSNENSNGSIVLPGNSTCQDEYISVSSCEGQDSILYFDKYYNLVEINGQCWFAENLDTDKYRNGEFILTNTSDNVYTNGSNNNVWETSGAYLSIQHLRIVGVIQSFVSDTLYSKMYNWYTTESLPGVCPEGWHVPSDCEWMYLESSLGMPLFEQQSTSAISTRGTSNQVGLSLKSQESWVEGYSNSNNSGFSALPLSPFNEYIFESGETYWWTSSQIGTTRAWYRSLDEGSSVSRDDMFDKQTYFSIRCIKD